MPRVGTQHGVGLQLCSFCGHLCAAFQLCGRQGPCRLSTAHGAVREREAHGEMGVREVVAQLTVMSLSECGMWLLCSWPLWSWTGTHVCSRDILSCLAWAWPGTVNMQAQDLEHGHPGTAWSVPG